MTKSNKNFNFKYNKFNPFVNEWSSSIYSFNKNYLNTLWSNKTIFNILNNYFNIRPNNISSLKKIAKNSFLKRIFVSLPEIKNSLNNINIFVYVFNKESIIFNKKIIKLQKTRFNNNKFSSKDLNNWTRNNELLDTNIIHPKDVRSLNVKLFEKFNIIILMEKFLYTFLKNFNVKINNKIIRTLYTKIYNNFNEKLPSFSIYKKNFKNNLISNKDFYEIMKKKLEKIHNTIKIKYYVLFFYKRYVTRIYFNKLKFNSINLFNLSKILHKIYDKHININIVNLKYLHLDSSIFTNAIVRKLKKRKSKVLKVLRKALILPKIPEIDSMFLLKKKKVFNDIIYNITRFNKYVNVNNINKVIFKSIKNTHLIGIKLEGKGRLTRRLTASRAVYKRSHIGSLKNIYSSSKGLSAVMSKGFDKSNINYINLNSYNRNGSYGIKSWHNTM